ncbi:MAG: hypothetical protein IAG13_05480, partial [Deltaproteobacteria bacterium]|nr:hypothetical protein [Nannocystaceae bacterium]
LATLERGRSRHDAAEVALDRAHALATGEKERDPALIDRIAAARRGRP